MENNNKINLKKLIENLIILGIVILYFSLLYFAKLRLNENLLINMTKLASLMLLFLCISVFEIAYHKDNGSIAIKGIEVLGLAIYTLTIWNITTRTNIEFEKYLIFTGIVFILYYFLKVLIIYTKEKKEYYNSLSDIHEIVKTEPTKKEAKKRKS